MANRALDLTEEEAATAVALLAAIAGPPETYVDLRVSGLVRKIKAAFTGMGETDDVAISIVRKPGDGLIRDHRG